MKKDNIQCRNRKANPKGKRHGQMPQITKDTLTQQLDMRMVNETGLFNIQNNFVGSMDTLGFRFNEINAYGNGFYQSQSQYQ
uniref:Uncharacterized protein n=2 Tax=Bursaphelenchus xylophilus TaxID=6326 RepID=A0A1I7RM65_BURXY